MKDILTDKVKVQGNNTSVFIVIPKAFAEMMDIKKGDEVELGIDSNMTTKVKKVK